MIAICCPSRRPEGLKRMRHSAEGTLSISYTADFPEFMPTVHKWNLLAQEAMKNPKIKLFMLAADDMIFDTPGWDVALLEHYASLNDKIHVYALQDSRDPDGVPHPIVTREYIETMGYFLPPIFLHWFVDQWTVDIAKANFCFTHFKAFKLIHDKTNDKGIADETHNGIRQHGWLGRDASVNDTCQHLLDFEKQRLMRKITRTHDMYAHLGWKHDKV